MHGRVILQAFSTPLASLSEEILQECKERGITHVQISPIQSHCSHLQPWYRLYQPLGTQGHIGNSLGALYDLQNLARRAHKIGIKIIVDVVLHHRTGCIICSPFTSIPWLWQRFRYRKTLDLSRFNNTEWGPRSDFETEKTWEEHFSFLCDLLWVGVDGFRIDAAKHIPPHYLRSLIQCVKEEEKRRRGRERNGLAVQKEEEGDVAEGNVDDLIVYCEVMDGNIHVSNEYCHGYDPNLHQSTFTRTENGSSNKSSDQAQPLHVSDFPLTYALIDAFRAGGSLKQLVHCPTVDPFWAVAFADCHDSLEGDSYSFPCPEDAILATCFLLMRGQGIVLVPKTLLFDEQESKDNSFPFGKKSILLKSHPNSKVRGALLFSQSCRGEGFSAVDHASSDDVLVIQRGYKGFGIINKSESWQDRPVLQISGLASGVYREMQYDFHVHIHDGYVTKWGNTDRGGFNIGTRDALAFVLM